jgi:predicted DsbA family dithiol-disulfide isomerase
MMSVATIEVYADIWCPFAHVGLRTVLRRRSELGRDDVPVRVRSWPLELVNGVPLNAESTAAHVEELREQVAPGLFAAFDPGIFPLSTLPALGLACAAYRKNDRTGEVVSRALRDELFEEGRDISRPDVLASVARTYDLIGGDAVDTAQVLAEWHGGERRGVKGSPHFFCGDLDSFCPSLVITRDVVGRVHLERDAEAFDTFLQQCLASA